MSEGGLLIRCAAPRPDDEEEIERWLAGRVRALADEGALLYRFAPPRADAAPQGSGDAWVVEIGAPGRTAEPSTVSALLGEMRMLGLDPAVFRARGQ